MPKHNNIPLSPPLPYPPNSGADFNHYHDSLLNHDSDSINPSIEKFVSMDKKNLFLKLYRGESKTDRQPNLNKRWGVIVSYKGDDGKTVRQKFYVSQRWKTIPDRERELQKMKRSFQAAGDITKLQPPSQKQHLLIEALKSKHAYIGHKGRLDYSGKVNKFLFHISYKDARLINHQDGVNYINHLQQRKLSNTTINNYLGTLKIIFNVLVSTGKLKKNPFSNIKALPKIQSGLQRFREDQQERLKQELQCGDPQLWLAVQFVYYCFIRPAELRRLTISNIDFEEGRIRVPGNKSKNHKTQTVIIPAPFLQYLREHQYHQCNGDHYIIGHNGAPEARPIGANTLTRSHRKILRKLGIGSTHSLYSWKHTGAWQAIKNGINLKELQMQLRHHSLDMVNEYLKNLGLTDMPNIASKFPAI